MRARRIFASALVVAGFAAGMPTSTDASKSSLSIKDSNSTLNNNNTLIVKPSNSTNTIKSVNNSNSSASTNSTDGIKSGNGTNSTNSNSNSSNTIEYSESERKKMHEELEDPILGFVYIDDPEAGNITTNNSVFRTASRLPNNSLPKPLFAIDFLEEYPLPEPPKPELKCLESNHWPTFPRMSWQFKGYCEDEYGQCFLRALRKRGAIVHNWQCWKRDDGWWQADYTHIHAYLAVIPELDEALASVIGHKPHCE